MASPAGDRDRTVVGTFSEARQADLAAQAARKAGFGVERGSRGEVVLDVGSRPDRLGEAEGILAAYGAQEMGGSLEVQEPLDASEAERTGPARGTGKRGSKRSGQARVRAEQGATVELVEEQLRARTRPVQTGEVTIRKEVVTETRTLEVPVKREELVIERTPVERHAFDSRQSGPSDPLVDQLVDRLRHMQSGEVLRIPIVEEEIIIHKRPVVVEEVTLGKRVIEDSQTVSETVRREEARIEDHGDVRIHGD
jgi:stress response protein YsnF